MCRLDATEHRDRDVPTDVHAAAVDGDHRDAATGRVWVLESLGYPGGVNETTGCPGSANDTPCTVLTDNREPTSPSTRDCCVMPR